ncbi:hypothetical protein H9P43_006933 [Blastocladiella emersonii ATCC 22665]|nr:hypothetical protein H9P43_006925 [Blastocladiella emersonii ATCC 22665]KAI9175570.1 hypothetical protein H9P43_006933 [Blastocladiella emersonii ATCC 22665]
MSVIQHNFIVSQDASGMHISQDAAVGSFTSAHVDAGTATGLVQNNIIVHNAASGADIDQSLLLVNVTDLTGPVPHGFTVQNNIIQANDASGVNIHQAGDVVNVVSAGGHTAVYATPGVTTGTTAVQAQTGGVGAGAQSTTVHTTVGGADHAAGATTGQWQSAAGDAGWAQTQVVSSNGHDVSQIHWTTANHQVDVVDTLHADQWQLGAGSSSQGQVTSDTFVHQAAAPHDDLWSATQFQAQGTTADHTAQFQSQSQSHDAFAQGWDHSATVAVPVPTHEASSAWHVPDCSTDFSGLC